MSDLNKLRWRCRRGTLELDLMLTRYLERCFSAADLEEQGQFLKLLELEDSDLLRFMLGERQTPDCGINDLIEKIRSLPVLSD